MIDLGLTVAELWSLTPYQISRLWKRYQARERGRAQNMAIMACSYLNSHRDTNQMPQPFHLEQFMPFPEVQQMQAPQPPAAERQIAKLRAWAHSPMSGVVVRKRRDAA